MPAPDPTEHSTATPLHELLAVVPRWVDRTRGQAEIARTVVAHLPCVGGLVARREHEEPPGVPEHERIDVLAVLADDGGPPDRPDATETGTTTPAATPAPADEQAAATSHAVPSEGDLAIQHYDSLAASQVVPRLATLTPQDLRAVHAYEAANRHRQTILNRVAQLLDGT